MKNLANPAEIEKLDAFLVSQGIRHFSATEVLTMRRARIIVPVPRQEWWVRIIRPLQLAERLREIVGPLSIGNGFRPRNLNAKVGGSRGSKHVVFRALDLDLVDTSVVNCETFYNEAVGIWVHEGRALKMGIGLYSPWRGRRVHIDCGASYRRWKKKYVDPIAKGLR